MLGSIGTVQSIDAINVEFKFVASAALQDMKKTQSPPPVAHPLETVSWATPPLKEAAAGAKKKSGQQEVGWQSGNEKGQGPTWT